MFRLLIFIFLGWIANKCFRALFPVFSKSYKSSPENDQVRSRKNMDIQDAEFEDVE